jgi:hypothetical protein
MSDEPYQDTLHLFNCHVHILDDRSIEHSCRHIPPPAFLLQGMKTLEDNTFPGGEPVSHIGEVVTRVMRRHVIHFPY